jgi:adenylate cyclase class 2
VLAGLGHDAFVSGDNQQGEVDTGCAGDHGVDQPLMPGHVHEVELVILLLKLGEAEVDGDAPLLLFWEAVAVDPGESLDQGRLAMVDMSRGAEDDVSHGGNGTPGWMKDQLPCVGVVDAMVETEVKIPVQELAAVRQRLEQEGARCLQPLQREVNLLLDSDDRRLMASGQALRLRAFAGRWTLTFKGRSSYQGAVKRRDEIELEVDEQEVLMAILERLGYCPTLRYEKDRELWRLDQVEVALDHTPMGDFVELEGDAPELERAAERLGLEVERAVRGSYIRLWQRLREDEPHRQLPEDMVFEP